MENSDAEGEMEDSKFSSAAIVKLLGGSDVAAERGMECSSLTPEVNVPLRPSASKDAVLGTEDDAAGSEATCAGNISVGSQVPAHVVIVVEDELRPSPSVEIVVEDDTRVQPAAASSAQGLDYSGSQPGRLEVPNSEAFSSGK